MRRARLGCLALTLAVAGARPAFAVDAPDGGVVAEPPADAEAPTVAATLDRPEASVGDRVTLTVSAVGRAGVVVTLPAKLDLGKLEQLDRDDGPRDGVELGNGRRAHRFVLGVAAYETGDIEVPALTLSYIKPSGEVRTVATAPITLHVRSLVSDDDKAEVEAARPPRSAWVEDRRLVRALLWGAGLGGAGLVLLVTGLVLRRLWRRRAHTLGPSLAPERPADAVAMERLAALRAAGDYGRDGYRPFYFALTEIVRAYLGARYGFDALDMTTTELHAALARTAPQLAAGDAAVARFFAECDLVKFAKAGSSDAAALAALDEAQALVLSTTRALEERVAPATMVPATTAAAAVAPEASPVASDAAGEVATGDAGDAANDDDRKAHG